MSDFRTIAIITETLRAMLDLSIKKDLGDEAKATAIQPVKEGGEKSNTLPKKGVNVYLYHISPNPAWRNADLPTRSSSGIPVQRPRLSLDLHYLLTFYGDDNHPLFEPQLILGSVARTLHSHPILTQQQIQKTMDTWEILGTSNPSPADEIEQVKFTMIPLSLEELSKLWSVFFQNHYALSVVYHASVIFIDGIDEPYAPLPVKRRNLYAEQIRQCHIDKVVNQSGISVEITLGSTIEIIGSELRSNAMILRVGGVDVNIKKLNNADIRNNKITLKLEGSNFTDGLLQAGILGVQIIHTRQIGTPPVSHEGVESNIVPFVLHPTIKIPSSVQLTGKTAFLPIEFSPPLGEKQRVNVMLTELNPKNEKIPQAYQHVVNVPNPNPGEKTVTNLIAALQGIEPATYLVRVLVDGAESMLMVETDPDKPSYFVGPNVEII